MYLHFQNHHWNEIAGHIKVMDVIFLLAVEEEGNCTRLNWIKPSQQKKKTMVKHLKRKFMSLCFTQSSYKSRC